MRDEPFVVVLPWASFPRPGTSVRSNFCHVGVRRPPPGPRHRFRRARQPDQGVVGQAIQNANLMLGEEETAGLMLAPLFP
jgi:N-acetyl-gamma-glutamyl-phosphate reductase